MDILSEGFLDPYKGFGQIEAIRLNMSRHMDEVSADLDYLKETL